MYRATKVWADGLMYDESRQLEYPMPQPSEVLACEQFIARHGVATKTIRTKSSSYVLKHRVEAWLRLENQTIDAKDRWGRDMRGTYVSNGAFIQAAINLGFQFVQARRNSPNAFFNMSIKSWNKLERETEIPRTAPWWDGFQ